MIAAMMAPLRDSGSVASRTKVCSISTLSMMQAQKIVLYESPAGSVPCWVGRTGGPLVPASGPRFAARWS